MHVGWRTEHDRGLLQRKNNHGTHSLSVCLGQIPHVCVSVSKEPVVSDDKKAIQVMQPHEFADRGPAPVPFVKRKLG